MEGQRLSVAKNPQGGKDEGGRDSAQSEADVWALVGGKPGDDAQVLALAAALGRAFAVKRLGFRGLYRVPNLLAFAPFGLDRARSDALAPPWPRLVIAVGRRAVPVARWIRRQSGGRTRLVHLGRPRAPYRWFDLIVTTPQYGVPARANVLTIPLPLGAGASGKPSFDDLPRPRIGVLIGGASGAWRLAEPARLGEGLGRLARRHSGSLLVTTSRRTGHEAEALIAALDAPARVHRFGQGANPYGAILAAADAFVVTADSASMMADAAATGHALLLAPAAYRPTLGQRLTAAAASVPGYDWAVDLGLITRPRALGAIAEILVAAGHARWFSASDDLAPPAVAYDEPSVKDRAVARVEALLTP